MTYEFANFAMMTVTIVGFVAYAFWSNQRV